MLLIDSLIIMQEQVRHAGQLDGMVAFVRGGGLWTADATESHAKQYGRRSYPIYISRFPDGVLMIHDGHHRILATYLAGRRHLMPNEYVQVDWRYEQYMEIAFGRGYVTPHDPRTEVRVADFAEFKKQALSIDDHDEATVFIRSNRPKYAMPRSMKSVAELAATVRFELERMG